MSLLTEAIRLPSKLAYSVSNQVPHECRSRRDQTSKPLESALSSHGRPLSRSSALAHTWEKLLKWRDFHEHASAGVRPKLEGRRRCFALPVSPRPAVRRAARFGMRGPRHTGHF